jgi:hypothetical protein
MRPRSAAKPSRRQQTGELETTEIPFLERLDHTAKALAQSWRIFTFGEFPDCRLGRFRHGCAVNMLAFAACGIGFEI